MNVKFYDDLKNGYSEEINKDELIDLLHKKLEAYKNMRKEAINYLKEFGFYGFNKNWQDLLNILNKVGGSDE